MSHLLSVAVRSDIKYYCLGIRIMRHQDDDLWIARQSTRARARLRLFCLPYAGGGARIYRTWADALPDDVEVCAVQLPGRDQRHNETPITDASKLIDALSVVLRPYLDMPYALFGHSMGAVLAYELARRLGAAYDREPSGLFVSAHGAPHLPRRRPPSHHLPDDKFIARMKALNGTPAEVFANPELLALLLPMLRADFKLVETYAELPGPVLTCPVLAIGGRSDSDVPPTSLEGWATVTRGPFKSMLFEGDHFFINSERETLLRVLKHYLSADYGGGS
jgi:medium-chain acyl-[acyl-carrier-protein] hydrolase